MELQISIIVPVYNVENYLKSCLDSILGQDFENMEIICVDDKSTDGSLTILRDYEKRYERIKVCAHEVNKGLSAARNRGIEEAAGKYLWFVDSDDMIKPDACRVLYQYAEADDVDIVYFNMDFLNDEKNGLIRERCEFDEINGVYTGRQMFCMYQQSGKLKVEVVRQLIRREFLLKNQIAFYEGILHEDMLFSFLAAMKAERVIDMNESLYIYRQRSGSIMYSQKDKSAVSMWVNLINISSFWIVNDFSQEEDRWISNYIEKLYTSYRYYKHYQDDHFVAGRYKEQFLGRLLEKKSSFTVGFLDCDLARLITAKNVILYGAGRIATEVYDVLKQNHIMVSNIVVTEISGNARFMNGIPITSISELKKQDDQIIVLGTDEKFYEAIIDTLKSYGFYYYVKPIKVN